MKLGDVVAVDHGGADDVEGELEEREDQKHPHWYLRVQELFMDSQVSCCCCCCMPRAQCSCTCLQSLGPR